MKDYKKDYFDQNLERNLQNLRQAGYIIFHK